MSKTLDQERAEFAWEQTKDADKDFKNLASGAPSMVMSNGLMQALAFWNEKGDRQKNVKGDRQKLVTLLVKWLGERVLNPPKKEAKFEDVMKALIEGDADLYFRATEETLAMLKWIRQFAKTRVKGE